MTPNKQYKLHDFSEINPYFIREFRKFKITTFLDVTEMVQRYEKMREITDHKTEEAYFYSLLPHEQKSLNNKFCSQSCEATLKDGSKVFVVPVLKAFDPEWSFDKELEPKEHKPWVLFFSGNDDTHLGMRFHTEKEADDFLSFGADIGELDLAWHN